MASLNSLFSITHDKVKLHLCLSCAYESREDLVEFKRTDEPNEARIVCGTATVSTQLAELDPVLHSIKLNEYTCDQIADYIFEIGDDYA